MTRNPICIITPTGLECMSSPLKNHKPSGQPCVDEHPSDEMEALRTALHGVIVNQLAALGTNAAFQALEAVDRGLARKTAADLQRRADVIARVVDLLAFCTVLPADVDVPFTVFLAGELSPGRRVEAQWSEKAVRRSEGA